MTTGTKWLRYEVAKHDKVYLKIVKEAIKLLTDVGAFSKDDVMQQAGFGIIDTEVIRWDYIQRMIEEECATQLIPLARSFFERHLGDNGDEAASFPQRYVATGHGKKTFGYANASAQNGSFVVYTLHIQRKRAAGVTEAANQTLKIGQQNNVPELAGEDPLRIPRTTLLAESASLK